MQRLICTLSWFFSLALIANLILDQSLGFFWLMIGGLSIFLGLQTGNKLDLGDNPSIQLTSWANRYQELSYFKQQLYLGEVINNAIKCNQTKQALDFLDRIIKAEPDNETAKSLMASIWGTELIKTI
jgi:hypothetical protein